MPERLRILFMGTPDFAAAALRRLHQGGKQIVGVVTAPDKPAGRGMKLQHSAVKEYAVANGLKVLQPEKLKSPDFIQSLRDLKPDLGIVVAFRMLPEAVWNLPSKGTFNLHGSLLPRYRGAAPIHWAVINGERETGITTFFLKNEIDTGDIILQSKTSIGDSETAGDVYHRLMEMGADLVLKTVEAVESGQVPTLPQDEATDLKPAPKIFKETARIDWNRNAQDLHNFIRGLNPHPSAWTTAGGKVIKIHRSHFERMGHSNQPGDVTVINDAMKVACRDGYVLPLELQSEGKKAMSIADWLRGNKAEAFK